MKYTVIIIILLFINSDTVYAGRGCCSHHGGQAYCDTSVGKWVCKDGTYSPSCTCYKENSNTTNNTTTNNQNTINSNNKNDDNSTINNNTNNTVVDNFTNNTDIEENDDN